MLEKTERVGVLGHAAKGNVALRRVLDDMYERLDAQEAAGASSTPPAAPRPQAPAAEISLDERAKIAIWLMDPATFGADGKPNARAISAALGEPFTAADRDRVWAAMQEDA